MTWVFSSGMLEPEEVQENMDDTLQKIQHAGSNGWLFVKLTDDVGDDIIFQVPEIIKVRNER